MSIFDEIEADESVEDGSWNWYYVTMISERSLEEVEQAWPVCADSFDAAMDIYQVVLNLKYNKQ
jgi:hypothetical protein